MLNANGKQGLVDAVLALAPGMKPHVQHNTCASPFPRTYGKVDGQGKLVTALASIFVTPR